MTITILTLSLWSHTPIYGSGNTNCFSPTRKHTWSQAIYLKGSGGIEVHVNSSTDPFNALEGELIHVDAVVRDRYDQSTYQLYIGCGGCMPIDPIVSPAINLTYKDATLEPFTQVCVTVDCHTFIF